MTKSGSSLPTSPPGYSPPMASENVELVRTIYADWERGEVAEWVDPEIEWVIADGPDPGTWKGLAAVADAMRDQLSDWEDWRIKPEEVREIDDERVLVLMRASGRGKTSGVEIENKRAQLLHIRGGKVTRSVYYHDREQALADLGLKE
jgi:ketosteroid isomerase-like protein